jgi:putative Holliday junction resolvase
MGRILAIDFGTKRTGIAVTDPLKIIASPLTTVRTHLLQPFLQTYISENEVEALVLGFPKRLNNTDTDTTAAVRRLETELKKKYPQIPVHLIDERFTSVLAKRSMIENGIKKKDRQDKSEVDMVSATIILQSFMERI